MIPAKLAALAGKWSYPTDDAAWVVCAAGFALVVAALASRDLLENVWRASRPRFLATAGIAAGFLTLGYAAHFLRGGPRIIDATTYWLQAKALAHGHLAWTPPFPSASFRGRFLLFHEGKLAGIFPPGWPLVLAFGFALGSPMIVGVALSAGLVIATYALAFELAPTAPPDARERTARLAALLSAACAALRYHTADPMSHAASALAITVALVLAFRATRGEASTKTFVALGASIGFILCTRPFSAIPIFLIAAFLVRKASRRDRIVGLAAILPGLLFLLLAQHAATGSFFLSTQRAYYATSDGPPDCFRYGFGQGIGCLHEHGDFVRARLQNGFGLVAALGTTLRRLHMHLSDALNAWPLAFFAAPFCFRDARRDARLRVAWTLVLLQILAYFPFYFDGDYPGGGARFFADVLPVEHALVAIAATNAFPKLAAHLKSTVIVGLLAIAFGVHGAFDHLALADRDGGRPMFEPERLQDAHVENGLLFVDTDHGFDLAYDPSVTDPKHGLVVARLRNDAHDRLLFEHLGKPSWAYRFAQQKDKEPTLLPFTPQPADVAGHEDWRFESEVDWPPLAQSGAWAEPIFATGLRQNCPSNGQALAVRAAPSGTVTLAVPVPRKGTWSIHPWMLVRPGDSTVTLSLGNLGWMSPPPASNQATCVELSAQTIELDEGEVPLVIAISSGEAAIDRVELMPSR